MSDQILTASALAQSLRDEELAEARRMADLAQDQAETLRRLLKQAQAALEAHERGTEGSALTNLPERLDQKQWAALLEAIGLPSDAAWNNIIQWVECTRHILTVHTQQWAAVHAALDLKQSTSHDAVIREIKKLTSVRVSPQ